ncbi:ABC-2 type transport system permease protein [Paenibacillus sp. UNCCL117]|uniref:ABC transporter permease n=1 Tax=unclassified Paenibacillus TaxID=185978 RepID=UPI0008923AE2|nr:MULTISPECIES: ABC-2 family transporter protein [unclassified Paenibacillus]SDE29343.1 ABC-2 type transport system permease protein [Paenibacillus sp. cl123]SFW63293.1 ABC-2 type transport system permease protein [Paenibacillus sp. UNCCL117]
MNAALIAAKYAAVGRITIRRHLAYIADFLMRTVFLVFILYIFTQLWQATFRGEGELVIAGYSFKQLVWYLILTESMTMACPSLCTRIEEEVKSGDVGYKLTKPISYIGLHYMGYVSEIAVRFAVNLAVGSLLGWLVLGPPGFGAGWAVFFLLAVFGFSVNFFLNLLLALCAFWVEETRGLEFVYHKLLFTIGGMLMPLEMFPELLQKICVWLPFQAVLYFPAKAAVQYESSSVPQMLAIQMLWLVVLGLAAVLVYRRGVKKLHVNGG